MALTSDGETTDDSANMAKEDESEFGDASGVTTDDEGNDNAGENGLAS